MSIQQSARRPWRRIWFAIPALVVLAVLLADAFGVPLTTTPRAHAATSCQKFEIIGVRGSGETVDSQPHSMGSTVGTAADSARAYLMTQGYSSSDVGLLPGINYKAISVDDWAALFLGDPAQGLQTYEDSVQTGIDELHRQLTSEVGRCPHIKLILIGYSQGAEVVHRVIDGLGGIGALPATQVNAIAGVLLFSDPVGDDTAYYAHMVNPNTGLDEGVGTQGGAVMYDPVNPPLAHRTIAVCFDADDLVCHWPSLPGYSHHDDYDTCCTPGVDLTDYWGQAVARFAAPAGTSATGAVNDRLNTTRMFVRGTDNLDHETYLPDGGATWHAFTAGTGPTGVAVASDPVSVVDQHNVIRVFVRGADNRLYERHHTASAGWSGWTSLGGTITGQPHAVVDTANIVRVYVRTPGASGHIWEVYLLDGQSAWQWHDTGLFPASDAVPIVDYDGIVRVYALDNLHNLVEEYLRPGWTWSDWSEIVVGGAFVGVPTPIVDPRNDVRVYVRDSSSRLWENFLVPGQTWGVFNVSQDSARTLVTNYDPVAIADHEGVIRVYASGPNNHLWERHLTPGSAWSVWVDLGGDIQQPIGAVQDLGSTLYVFVHNANDSFGQDTLPLGGSWSGIVTRGGVTLS